MIEPSQNRGQSSGFLCVKNHRIDCVSSRFSEWTHQPSEQILGSLVWDLVVEKDKNNVEKFCRDFVSDDTSGSTLSFTVKTKHGPIITLDAELIVLANENDESNAVRYGVILTWPIQSIIRHRTVLNVLKMESVGELASGIAHEFNNILMGIMGYVSLAKRSVSDDESISGPLEKAEKSCISGRNLTQELLSFSRPATLRRENIDLPDFLKSIAAKHVDPEKYTLSFHTEEPEFVVAVDVGLISEAIENLYENAMHAMPMGGEIAVYIKNRFNPHAVGHIVAPGHYVEIIIQDQGPGVDKKIIHKILDPFFSTQINTRGLGMTKAFFVVRHHGGILTLEEQRESGFTCKILLPVKIRLKNKSRATQVLVIDDEELVLETICELLNVLGYDQMGCVSLADAKKLFQDSLKNDMSFDVIMVDLSLCDNPVATVQEFRQLKPRIKCIAISGDSGSPVAKNPGAYNFDAFVSKPLDLTVLDTVIDDVCRD